MHDSVFAERLVKDCTSLCGKADAHPHSCCQEILPYFLLSGHAYMAKSADRYRLPACEAEVKLCLGQNLSDGLLEGFDGLCARQQIAIVKDD